MADYTPTEQETTDEKIRLIGLVRPELKEHGLVDLTDFVNKKSTEGFKHPGFVRSLAYRIEEIGLAEVIVRKEWAEFYIKRNILSKRNPILFATIIALIGFGFAIAAGLTNWRLTEVSKEKEERKLQLRQILEPVYDSLDTIRHDLKDVQDTLAKYKKR